MYTSLQASSGRARHDMYIEARTRPVGKDRPVPKEETH